MLQVYFSDLLLPCCFNSINLSPNLSDGGGYLELWNHTACLKFSCISKLLLVCLSSFGFCFEEENKGMFRGMLYWCNLWGDMDDADLSPNFPKPLVKLHPQFITGDVLAFPSFSLSFLHLSLLLDHNQTPAWVFLSESLPHWGSLKWFLLYSLPDSCLLQQILCFSSQNAIHVQVQVVQWSLLHLWRSWI